MKDIICTFMEHVLGNPTVVAMILGAVVAIVAMALFRDKAVEIVTGSVTGIFALAQTIIKPRNGEPNLSPGNPPAK